MSAALLCSDRDRSAPPSARAEAAAFVLALRSRGIRDLALLRAMERVPREVFAPRRFRDLSRQDVALPLPAGRTMTAPGIVASMLLALALRPDDRVLEVGTGSGYVTALLVATGGLVLSFEHHPALVDGATERLDAAGFGHGCGVVCGDGFGLGGAAGLFDRILLNGAVRAVPDTVLDRLAPGGRLVGGVSGQDGVVRLLVVSRGVDGSLRTEVGPALRLSPLLPGRLDAAAFPATEA